MKYQIKELVSPAAHLQAFQFGACRVLVGMEPTGKNGLMGWHLSISHHRKNPTWDEIKSARYHFVPNEITMAMILPPKEQFVNVHEYCFHLYEIEGE